MRRNLVVLEELMLVLQVDESRLGDITPWLQSVIGFVGLSGLFVPVGGPDTPGACFLEGIMKSSDSTK